MRTPRSNNRKSDNAMDLRLQQAFALEYTAALQEYYLVFDHPSFFRLHNHEMQSSKGRSTQENLL
eukprot:2844016-Amphidinium_carterae.1